MPLWSVAVQVRVMVCGQLPETASVNVTVGLESHVSEAVAMPVLLGAVDCPHSTVILVGQKIVGGLVFCTVT